MDIPNEICVTIHKAKDVIKSLLAIEAILRILKINDSLHKQLNNHIEDIREILKEARIK